MEFLTNVAKIFVFSRMSNTSTVDNIFVVYAPFITLSLLGLFGVLLVDTPYFVIFQELLGCLLLASMGIVPILTILWLFRSDFNIVKHGFIWLSSSTLVLYILAILIR